MNRYTGGNKETSKTLFRLIQLVGTEVTVYLRSQPEIAMTGTLDNFDVNLIPSMLVLFCDGKARIVNMQDVSFIQENR